MHKVGVMNFARVGWVSKSQGNAGASLAGGRGSTRETPLQSLCMINAVTVLELKAFSNYKIVISPSTD